MPQLTEGILNVRGAEGGLEVLLVSEDEEGDVLVVLVLHRPPQLHLGLVQPLLLGAVHHEDDPVRAPRVAPPQRPDPGDNSQLDIFFQHCYILLPLLPPDVPDEEGEAPGPAHGALHPLAVEAHSGHRVHVVVELEAVQRGGLARPVQPDHHDVEVLLG